MTLSLTTASITALSILMNVIMLNVVAPPKDESSQALFVSQDLDRRRLLQMMGRKRINQRSNLF
jgi:hypothetical protein